MNDGRPLKVLFLCLGNICRSPLAEGVFVAHAEAGRFVADSAGTSAYHRGSPPDPGSIKVAARHGLDIQHQRSRPLTRDDFGAFDFIIPMDRSNQRNLLALGELEPHRCPLLREFDPEALHDFDVPDPYGGGIGGFQTVYDMLTRSMEGLIAHMEHHGHARAGDDA